MGALGLICISPSLRLGKAGGMYITTGERYEYKSAEVPAASTFVCQGDAVKGLGEAPGLGIY